VVVGHHAIPLPFLFLLRPHIPLSPPSLFQPTHYVPFTSHPISLLPSTIGSSLIMFQDGGDTGCCSVGTATVGSAEDGDGGHRVTKINANIVMPDSVDTQVHFSID
jgi:hypothetical protein